VCTGSSLNFAAIGAIVALAAISTACSLCERGWLLNFAAIGNLVAIAAITVLPALCV
jgi:hypothetical protein